MTPGKGDQLPGNGKVATPARRKRRLTNYDGGRMTSTPTAGPIDERDDQKPEEGFRDVSLTTVSWLLLIYRVPSEPSRARVAIWRELKRLGGLYLQQAVCVLPDVPANRQSLERVRERIVTMDGVAWYFPAPPLPGADQAELIAGFREASSKEYAEIVEECDVKFVKEIEFERFRSNYTFEEAEEIRQDFEKIRRWFDKVRARDWFQADGRAETEVRIEHCSGLLESFEEDVYRMAKENES